MISLDIIQILLECQIGDTLNQRDTQGFNCLYYATYYGHLDVVELLKSHNVSYSKDNKGTSCLHIATQKGFHHIVRFYC